MIRVYFILVAFAASPLFQLVGGSSSDSANIACSTLQREFPDHITFPNDTLYSTINEGYFTAEAWLGPACILSPDSSESMGHAVRELAALDAKFAVKGGGWMPIAGAANINSTGVLLSTTNLRNLELSDDRTTVSVASGHNWSDVYTYLSPYGLSVVGSRIGVVGVPGFLLGGGMSFFSNEYGWASANVMGFEAILSDGSVVYATATNDYSDLYWALRGGGNSFAIVTRFVLKTIEMPTVAVGTLAYGSGQREPFLESLFDFSQTGVLDQRSFVLPTISFVPAAGPNVTYSAMLFYGDGNQTSSQALERFLPPIAKPTSNTFSARTLANWTAEGDEGFSQVHGLKFRFFGLSMLADLDAMFELHDTFFKYAQERGTAISGFMATLAMNPISKSYIINNRGIDPAGDPMGIDADAAPYFFCEETFGWSHDNDTNLVEKLIADVNSELRSKLAPVLVPFLYLNNAGGGQDVFPGYNSTNVARLKSIKQKYDASGIYTDQMAGGFKL